MPHQCRGMGSKGKNVGPEIVHNIGGVDNWARGEINEPIEMKVQHLQLCSKPHIENENRVVKIHVNTQEAHEAHEKSLMNIPVSYNANNMDDLQQVCGAGKSQEHVLKSKMSQQEEVGGCGLTLILGNPMSHGPVDSPIGHQNVEIRGCEPIYHPHLNQEVNEIATMTRDVDTVMAKTVGKRGPHRGMSLLDEGDTGEEEGIFRATRSGKLKEKKAAYGISLEQRQELIPPFSREEIKQTETRRMFLS
ncbi:hypothetical protein VNO78_11635 [Psophocarpus tetragonolobus]|uniref:Uncharacterized protein n=1 Tax=Psophocarpus tetragonolobus TaxID=3891 RepID=A0AAN9SU45_PSOTE